MARQQTVSAWECRRILGVSEHASAQEIRQAYLDLVQVWHPDRFQTDRLKRRAESKLKEINVAYEALAQNTYGNSPKHTASTSSPEPPMSDEGYRPRSSDGFILSWRGKSSRVFVIPRLGLRLCLPLAVGTITFLAAWYAYAVVNTSVRATRSVLESGLHSATASSDLFRPSVVVNPLDDVRATVDYLNTWAALRITKHRESAPVAAVVSEQPHAAETPRFITRRKARIPTYPPTGNLIAPNLPFGVGGLTLTNRTQMDAAVKVAARRSTHRPHRHVYVRSGQSYTIPDLPTGEYFLFIELGKGWLPDEGSFKTDRRSIETIGPLSYLQLSTPTETRSDKYEINIRTPDE